MKLEVFVTTTAVFVGVASAQSFQGLGMLPSYTSSRAADLSGDGTTVIGNTNPQGQASVRAWRWRAESGMEDFGLENAGARGVSHDGETVVGQSFGVPTYRWQAGQPTVSVPLPGSNLQPGPGISGDGVTVIGNSNSGGYQAARWSVSGGVTNLPIPPTPAGTIVNPFGSSVAFAVNQDASVIGGARGFRYFSDSISVQPLGVCRWTASGGQFLLDASGQPVEGVVYDASSDGNTLLVLGSGSTSSFFRWTQAGGYQSIAGLVFSANDAIPRISGDGSTIISFDKMWTQSRGALPITQILTESGATFTGWSGLVATGIDFGATHLCGYGTNPMGQTEAWYATIPALGAGAVCAILALAASRRRRR